MIISLCEHKSGQMLHIFHIFRAPLKTPAREAIANLDARDFWCAVSGFGQFFIVSGGPTFVQHPLKIQMFGGQTFILEPTLKLFSRYVSTVGSKRRYHSSRVCVDVAGRDSCRWYNRVLVVYTCMYTDVAETSISNFCQVGAAFFGELPQARTFLLFGSYSGQIFSRRNLLTRRRK